MTKKTTTLELLGAVALQYVLARLLSTATTKAEQREERELVRVRVPAQRTAPVAARRASV